MKFLTQSMYHEVKFVLFIGKKTLRLDEDI